MYIYTGVPNAVPTTPMGFMVEPRQDAPGLFDITSVTTSQNTPEEGLSAFIFRVEAVGETRYIIQVAHQTTASRNKKLHYSFNICLTQCSQV